MGASKDGQSHLKFMVVEIYKKSDKVQLSDNLSLSEVHCKCSNPECNYTLISRELVNIFQYLRNLIGKPIKINSAYRCQLHNKSDAVKGKPASKHTIGCALDLKCPSDLPFDEFVAKISNTKLVTVVPYEVEKFVHIQLKGV